MGGWTFLPFTVSSSSREIPQLFSESVQACFADAIFYINRFSAAVLGSAKGAEEPLELM